MSSLTLSDGRLLDLHVEGDTDAPALLYHHGTPGGDVPLRQVQRAAAARGLRLITTSRPGYGTSTRHPGRRVVDVVADSREVLAHLGVDRCVVAGWSGGGPHALACAARLEQATGVLLIAGVGPSDADDLDFLAGMGEDNVLEFGAALEGESALRPFLEGAREVLGLLTPEDIVESLASILAPVDRDLVTEEFGEDLVALFERALETGVDGWLDDDLAFTHAWGFSLDEIATPTFIWQGSEDLMVPFAHGQWLARRVPGARVHLEQGEGHLSVLVGRLDAMLDELATTLR